jgi:hypothetical protein
METSKIMLLLQLAQNLDNKFSILEEAYKDSDREKFDLAKKSIIDLNNKINFLLK